MNIATTNPEFIKRIITDSKEISSIRNKFYNGEPVTPEEVAFVISTTPDKIDTAWGPGRLSLLPWSGIEHLHACITDTVSKNIEGDFLEAGVWKGGACIIARALYDDLKSDKKVFLADSFEGLPIPNPKRYPEDKNDLHYLEDHLKISLESVKENFRKILGYTDQGVIYIKGWFKDTLPNAPVEKLSVLRLDGDMYESTINILENLYPKLSVGGYCIIDDYHHYGCQAATADYRERYDITEPIIKVDLTDKHNEIYYWIKDHEIIPTVVINQKRNVARKIQLLKNNLIFLGKRIVRKILPQ